ncbi:MAG: PqqD family protein [Paludibacteraceae bacterium]|nr:PqqD family protein [Paludibacteraceae bacterium]
MNILYLKKYTFLSSLIKRNISDETSMVYNPENGDMYELNDVSSEIFDYLARGISGDEIVRNILLEYDIDEETVIGDLSPLLDRLIELNILILEQ